MEYAHELSEHLTDAKITEIRTDGFGNIYIHLDNGFVMALSAFIAYDRAFIYCGQFNAQVTH